mgnify:CR=1 FL=1
MEALGRPMHSHAMGTRQSKPVSETSGSHGLPWESIQYLIYTTEAEPREALPILYSQSPACSKLIRKENQST